MNTNLAKITSIVAIAGVAMFGLSACSAGAPTDKATASASASAINTPVATPEVLAPLTKTIDELKDAKLTAVVGQGININVPEAEVADWTGTSSDPNVVQFLPGGVQGQAITNPGLASMGAGKSDVTLTNSKTGQTVSFSVTVA